MPQKKKSKQVGKPRQQVVLVAHPQQQKKRPQPQRVQQIVMKTQNGRKSGAAVSLSTGTTVVTNASKSVTYSRREYVQLLTTPPPPASGLPSEFTGNVAVLNLNPGLSQTFPWLSSVSSFEQYRFKRISFSFQSSVPTNTIGQVVLVTNVDAKDPVMTSPTEIMSYSGAATGRVWDSHSHRVPQQAVTRKNYIRNQAIPANADLSLYDAGLFYAFCLGVPYNLSLGTLWVDYEVEFFTPKVLNPTRWLSIKGDRKTVTKDEPFGSDAKLSAAGGSNIEWSCPNPSERDGWCQIKLQPNGMSNLSVEAKTYTSVTGGGEEMATQFGGVNGQLASGHTLGRGAIDTTVGVDQAVTSINTLLAEIVDPSKAIDLFYRMYPEGTIGASNMIPSLMVNMWK